MNRGTVHIVDDDQSIQRSLRRLLESVGLTVDCFSSAHDFIERYDPDVPGCLLLDVRMPGLSGLELQDHLRSQECMLPIIFVTGYGDVPMTARAMKAGAVDFLQKPFNDQELLEAIERALARNAQMRQEQSERRRVQARVQLLTPREREVLERVVAGKTNKEIAAEFGITEKTIKVHRARVMEKMQADSLAQLVVLAQVVGTGTANVLPV
jgi:two-component system, LuxR family, response regulator FixJ